MAVAVLSFLVEKFGDFLIREAESLRGVGDQVQRLQRELNSMQAFLKEVDKKNLVDDGTKNRVKEVIDVAYDAEVAIDTYIYYRIARQRRGRWMAFVQRFGCFFIELCSQRQVVKMIERIQLVIQQNSESKSRYHIILPKSDGGAGEATGEANKILERRRLDALSKEAGDPDAVVGFQEDVTKLLSQLKNQDLSLRVVSIVGTGGIGKTTLARKIYYCSDVEDSFPCRSLIHVSQHCNCREIFLDIIKQLMAVNKATMKMDASELVGMIYDYLKDKKYLVLIDDIWEEEDWRSLKHAFPDVKNGSRVMLTTRTEAVATHADLLSPPYRLGFLNETDSWDLFLKKAFVREQSCPVELERVGTDIVNKCGGLPLAIVLLAALLAPKEKTESVWSEVLENVKLHLSRGPDNCSRILALSYSALPYHLKPCFLYTGLFPREANISVEKLIRLWVAEGFVQTDGENREVEDIGQEYLEQLIDKNMIQVKKRRSLDSRVVECRVHDVMRNYCIEEARSNNLFGIYSTERTVPLPLRRLAIHSNQHIPENPSAPKLRSFLSWHNSWRCFRLGDMKFLYVLDLENFLDMESPIEEIGEHVHLRYLALAKPSKISSSISNLWNLQTLRVKYDPSFPEPIVPNIFRNLKQLRHLYLEHAPIQGLRLDYLRNLQTLTLRSCKGMVEGLQKLTSLRSLEYTLYEPELQDPPPKFVVPTFEFPPNLTELTLSGHRHCLPRIQLQDLEKLTNLRSLAICLLDLGDDPVFSTRGFSKLRVLKLQRLERLERFKVTEGALPVLQRLKITECLKMTMLPEGLQHVASLQQLKLVAMSEDLGPRLGENGEDWSKIRRIPVVIRGITTYNFGSLRE